QDLNLSIQILVSQQVFICITADGCAFYSISNQAQPLFLIYLSKWVFLDQFHISSYILSVNLL
ncbi:hypothetical protein, partial [Acinetobacter sp. 3657]|uniref:hypothetical protein n=1 Tax=Acinetobacter sp. 3657 TaxID=2817764 RepID=UPI0032B71FD7